MFIAKLFLQKQNIRETQNFKVFIDINQNKIKISSDLNSFKFDRDNGRRTRILEICQNWRDKINKRDREDNKNTTNSHL